MGGSATEAPTLLTAPYQQPSTNDPLGQSWRDEFYENHGFYPTWRDEQIRLFSLAYPDEWFGSDLDHVFYNPDGSFNQEMYEQYFTKQPLPESRSWDTLDEALVRLSQHYSADEEWKFVRDVYLLYAGPPSRSQATLKPFYAYGGGDHLHINPGSLDEQYYVNPNGRSDADANVHHWAWAFAVSYFEGPIFATALNTGRERLLGSQKFDGQVNEADRLIGGAGIQMAYALSRGNISYDQLPQLFETWLKLK